MKKTAAFLGALMILMSAVSCSSKSAQDSSADTESSVTASSETAEKLSAPTKLSKTYYTKEKLDLPTEIVNGYYMAPFEGGSKYLIFGGDVDFKPVFYIASEGLTKFEKTSFSDFDTGANYSIAVTDDGKIVTFVNHVDYGDLPEPDRTSADYDEEKYDAAAKYTYRINTYSLDGKMLTSFPVDRECQGSAGKYSMIGEMCCDGKFVAVNLDGAYELFDIEGTYYGELKKDDAMTEGIGIGQDGKMVCAVSPKENRMTFCILGDDGKLTESDTVYSLGESIRGTMYAGSGEHSLYLRTTSAIYGIRTDDGTMEMLLDMNATGVGSGDVRGFSRGDDGNFTLFNVQFGKSTELTRFIPKTPEEVANMPVLTLGFCSSGDMSSHYMDNYVNTWNNDSSHDFRVEMKFYKYDCNVENGQLTFTGLDEITEDVLNGDLPDVLFLDDDGSFGRVNVFDKNAVCDLYEFMDRDEIFNRGYFVENALKCLEWDGKLTSVTPRFYLDMGWMAKTKFVGGGDFSSREKKLEMLIDPPVDAENWGDDCKLYRALGWVSEGVLSWRSWTDLEKGTCDFDSESFVRFLKYCNEADVTEIDYEHYTYDDPTAGMTQKEAEEYQREQSRRQNTKYIDDRAVFSHMWGLRYDFYAEKLRGEMGGEDVTFLDDYHLEFHDLMAINANSEQKEMAWEYIKSFLSIQHYKDETFSDERGYSITGGFPITKDGLKYEEEFLRSYPTAYDKMEVTKDDPKWRDYKGLVYMIDYEDYSYNIQLGELTDEEVAAVNKAIDRAVPQMYIDLTDGTFEAIAQEEMLRYFNGGCTAEQCADAMQSRLSIYLSERYST